ncbi:DsrE family protein [Cytophaga aurantiaca]|uniref:DsrE family protein n=1 Tax=Cytophaga aurantiaca TaxID=29530 RepID=UPI0003794EDB|nr:DsrE family protein [Cytophaga aurantiaca]
MSVAYKVVIQLSSNDILVQKATISQLNNILNALPSVSIELVMNGPGIDLILQNAPLTNTLEQLHERGIQFLVCKNSLNQKNLSSTSILSFCSVVPSAIAHLIVRQHEGWSYIKAGF